MGPKCEAARGNCYEAAFNLWFATPVEHGAWLCHGIVRQSQPPHVQMGHAWVEELHHGIWFVRDGLYPEDLIPRFLYYRAGHVSHVERYTHPEVYRHVSRTGVYGPWDPKVAAASHTHDNDSE